MKATASVLGVADWKNFGLVTVLAQAAGPHQSFVDERDAVVMIAVGEEQVTGCVIAATAERSRSASLAGAPRIDHHDAAACVVSRVPGGHGCLPGACDGGDLAIELADRAPRRAPLGRNEGIGAGGRAVEGQDAPTEIIFQHALDRLGQRSAALARRKERDSVPKLCFTHGGEVDLRAILAR